MDKRQEYMSQAASKTELDIHSSSSSDTDSNQELEAFIDDYEKEYWAAHKAEYKRNRDSSKSEIRKNIVLAESEGTSDADSCPDIQSAIDSCKDGLLPLRKTNKKCRQEFETYISGIKNFLVAHKSEYKRAEDRNKLKMATLCEESEETSELDSSQELRTFVGAYRDRLGVEDESEPEKDVHSSDLDETSVVDTSQQLKARIVCKDSSKPEMDTYAEVHANSDEDSTPDIEEAIAACRNLRALREISKTCGQGFETYIRDIKDSLVALQSECKPTEDGSKPKMVTFCEELDDTSKVDSGQELETSGGACRDQRVDSQTEKYSEESESQKEVHSLDLDETSDADTSQELEACANVLSYLAERKRVQNDDSLDECSKIVALREGNARLEESCEILRRCMKKRREVIRRMKTEADTIHRLQDVFFNTKGSESMVESDLDEIIESCNNLLRKRKN